MTTAEIITAIIAIISLIISIASFLCFDIRTKRLDIKLKQYELEDYENQNKAMKEANLSLSYESKCKGSHSVVLSNNGPCIARNITIQVSQESDSILSLCKDVFPIESLIPTDSRKLPLLLLDCSPNKVYFDIVWDDDSATCRTAKIPLTMFDI